MKSPLEAYAPYILLTLLFVAAILFRPLMPVDETRYMTVAWEMFLHKQYAVMSLNFAPYHHKPPMLFWLINAAWEIFGVSRITALIPILAASAAVILLTKMMAQRLFPAAPSISNLAPWLLLGSLPFLMYNTIIMFDMMVTVWILATLLVFWDYSKNPRPYLIAIAGLLIGAGVLTKGPVMYLYVLWPLVLYKFWRSEDAIPGSRFYKAIGMAVLTSFAPILLWLVPALTQTDGDFAFWLVWNQTAGRITGNFGSADVQSPFFYLMILPILFLPWIFIPSVWKKARTIPIDSPAIRFLAAATIPVILSFSLIAGKKPHYMLPLLPFITIAIAFLLEKTGPERIKQLSIIMVILTIAGQAVAGQTFLHKYDLSGMAAFYQEHKDKDWAYLNKYHGQLGFLARMEKPIESMEESELPQWFDKHPEGLAIIRYDSKDDVKNYDELYSMPYRSKYLGVFKRK